MCIVNMAVERLTTWRQAPSQEPLTISGTNFIVLPPSPLRVAAMYVRPLNQLPQPIFFAVSSSNWISIPPKNNVATATYYITEYEYPGLLRYPLIAQQFEPDAVWWEAVIDSDTSRAVQVIQDRIKRGEV